MDLARNAVQGTSRPVWHAGRGDPPLPGGVLRALRAARRVLAHHDPNDDTTFDVPADFVESVLIDSGRPALILPHAGKAHAEGHSVLVAWKGTRESAHALSAALPFLARAREIHLVCSDETRGDGHDGPPQVRHYLGTHRLGSIKEHPAIGGHDAGRDLLSLAADIRADLLVMGCYGRSRAREWVLGGASRGVLRHLALPVLMAH